MAANLVKLSGKAFNICILLFEQYLKSVFVRFAAYLYRLFQLRKAAVTGINTASDYFFDEKLSVGVHDHVFAQIGNGFEIIVGDIKVKLLHGSVIKGFPYLVLCHLRGSGVSFVLELKDVAGALGIGIYGNKIRPAS